MAATASSANQSPKAETNPRVAVSPLLPSETSNVESSTPPMPYDGTILSMFDAAMYSEYLPNSSLASIFPRTTTEIKFNIAYDAKRKSRLFRMRPLYQQLLIFFNHHVPGVALQKPCPHRLAADLPL
ncbi:MAG: hypothetical protein NVSMB27_41090 [Ktedonobacteraceae bacterium]